MYVRIIALLLINLICLSTANAQKLSKRFVSKTAENGIIYFVKPYEMPHHGSNKMVTKPMLYDITLITNKDSVAFCATVYTKQPMVLNSVQINTTSGLQVSQPLQKIFVGMEKKHYKSRYRFYLTQKEYETMYRGDAPFEVNFGDGIIFAIPKGKWAKESNVHKNILQLASLNEQQ
jgi:hypothetical protein